jgi:hypothetical protein
MRSILWAALAAASLLSIGALATSAEAGALPASMALTPAAVPANIQKVAAVCGANGCSVVQTRQVRHFYKPGTPKSFTGAHI